MKLTCCRCEEEKNSTEFRKDASRKTGFAPMCKSCRRIYDKSNYMERYGDAVKANSKARFQKAREVVDTYKAFEPCMCGEDDICCLEFHHRDPDGKDFTIAGNMNRSLKKIVEEIRKCIVVCRNCHAKIHAGQISLWRPHENKPSSQEQIERRSRLQPFELRSASEAWFGS